MRKDNSLLPGLMAVLLWSTVATAFKLTLAYTTPAVMLLYASLFSTLSLAGVLLTKGNLSSALKLKQYLGKSLLLGAINPAAYYLILFAAYNRLPAQEAQPLNYTWALTLALFSIIILKQKITVRDIVSGLVCYSGVWVIATRGNVFSLEFADSSGVLLALGSTILWALYWVLNKKDTRDPVVALFQNFLIGTPLVLAWCLLTGESLHIEPVGLGGTVYIGVFEMGLTFVLWMTALKRSDNASRVGNLIFLSPPISLILIATVLGEKILPSTIYGVVLILVGLGWQRASRGSTISTPSTKTSAR
jgi:drug/metabolite transporter (DMT)-like permease